jgi:hypothetical protein
VTKHLILTAAILSLSLPISTAFAEPPDRGGEHHAPQFSAADAAAFTNARIAALKAGLELTPAQEKLWPAFEATLRDIAKARAGRLGEWREKRKEARETHDMLAMLRMGGKALAARGAELEKLADAAKPLYDSLDEAQKRRFGVLLHMMRQPFGPRHMGRGSHMGEGTGPAMGSGMGSGPQQEDDSDDKD